MALDPSWLGPRWELFERYCLPSVRQQTCQNFQWILFFDDETPEPFRAKAEALASDNIVPKFVGNLSGELIRETIRKHIPAGASHVITSRLDNDDGVSLDYVERLQAAFKPLDHKAYYNFTNGYIVSGKGRVYERVDKHNAFVSLAEPTDREIEGVWTYPHTEIESHAPVYQIGGGPGWLQVIHDANVSNKVRGRRIAPELLSEKFVVDASELSPEVGLPFWWERNVMYHLWSARDAAAASKRHLARMMGKGGRAS